MSASREKKQRQDAGPSPRQVQAEKEAAAYKKKVVTYTAIGVVCAVLVAALLIWNSGVFQRFSPAATVNGKTYSVSELSYYYQQAKYQSNYFYYAYGMSQYIPSDSSVQDEETGKTWREYYLDQALELMQQDAAIYDEAVKNGWSASRVADDVNKEIDGIKSTASSNGYSYGSYLKASYGKFMTAGDYKSILTRKLVVSGFTKEHQDSLSYSDEAINAYYEEHKDSLDTFEYSYLYFTPAAVDTKDADGNDLSEEAQKELKDAALADAKELAEQALAAIDGGKSIADVIKDLEPGSSADHTTTLGSSVSSLYSKELFGMKDGDTALVENSDSGYYVVQLHSRTLIQDPTLDTRHILFRAESSTDSDGNVIVPTDDAWNKAKADAEKALNEYKSGAQTAESFGALAEKYSEDSGSNINGGLYEGVAEGQFVSEYNSWLFDAARKPGDVEIIKHADADPSSNSYFGYHVVYFQGQNDPMWKLSVISDLRSDDMTKWTEGLDTYTGTLESGAKYVGQ